MEQREKQQLIYEKLVRLADGKRMTKILLINPHQFPGGTAERKMAMNKRYFAQPPYGIGILAAHLKHHGHVPELLDLNFELLSALNDPSMELNIAEKWKDAVQKKIDEFEPDLIGVSCMFTTVYETSCKVAAWCKSVAPTTPIFLGGVALINDPEGILRKNPAFDFLSLYEGDTTFLDALDVMNGTGSAERLQQLATLKDDVYVALDERTAPVSPIIDEPPHYGSLPLDRYSSVGEIGAYRFWLPPGTKAATVISNRGCRAHCAFCSVRGFCGPGVRARKVAAVVDEIESLQQRYGITHIMWLDDDLLYDGPRALRLFNEIVKRGIKITWDATNGVIAAAINEEIAAAATESGCRGLNLGIETGSERILKEMRKPATLEHYVQAASILKKFPQIFTRGFLIVGFPDEKLSDIQKTIDFARQLDLDWYTIQILCPLPSTSLYQQIFGPQAEKEDIDLGNLSFGSSHTGRQRKIETDEKLEAKDFDDLFLGDLQRSADPEMMNDIWFLADYRINYERIIAEKRPERLSKWETLLRDVADRITAENPLANLFLGMIGEQLGNPAEAATRYNNARTFAAGSAYWAKRFEVLQLSPYICQSGGSDGKACRSATC